MILDEYRRLLRIGFERAGLFVSCILLFRVSYPCICTITVNVFLFV